jgi:replicative DNA helicase
MQYSIYKNFLDMMATQPTIVSDTCLKPEHFPEGEERKTFVAMKELIASGASIDPIGLRNKGLLPGTIANLDSNTITSNWKLREREIIEAYKKRQVIHWAEKVRTDNRPSSVIFEEIESLLANLGNDTNFSTITLQQAVDENSALLDERAKRQTGMVGYSTGLLQLNAATLGFQPGNLYCIGARPSQGKTALLLNFAVACSVPFGILSAESSYSELMDRMVSMKSKVPIHKLKAGTLTDKGLSDVTASYSRFYNQEGLFYDEPNMNIDRACMIARQWVRRHGIKILFVDYLQILAPSPRLLGRPIRETMIDASKKLKGLARELNIPVVVASQLNRSSDGIRPSLSQLAESDEIGRTADVVILIWNRPDESTHTVETYLVVDKQRDGVIGDFPVIFDKATLRFLDKA